jgi:putative zinc finger/helix-turn-helix YgiT family protein
MQCRQCGKREVVMASTQYDATVQHDGRLHTFTIPKLELPVCQVCGAKVFTEEVDAQVNNALRAHLNFLTPGQIREAIKRVKMNQKEVSNCVGVAEATLSRWLNESQIQSRAMDNLLRVFFALPQVRDLLCGDALDPTLGLKDAVTYASGQTNSYRSKHHSAGETMSHWWDDWNGKREACRQVQEVVKNSGSTWGTGRVA